MKILITGGNGYIGNSLYNGLKDIYDVKKISRNDLDLTNSREVNDFFDRGGYDIIIHCAVKGGSRLKQDDWSVVDDNLKMYYNLISNKQGFNKFIHFGSGAEIFTKDKPYGFSKDVIRKSILNKNYFYNLRIFGVFDENELDTRFIKANIKRYLNNEPIIIHQNKQMNFIYMEDLVTLVEYYIINNDLPKEINCNYSKTITLEEIANMINNLDTYKVNIEIINKKSTTSYSADNFTDLGIKFIGLEQGIKEVYNKLKNEY
jgi:GDP-L-fucose synthase